MIEPRELTARQVDYTGQTFNDWTVLRYMGIKRQGPRGRSHSHYWLARCSCGNERVVQIRSLIAGTSKQCRDHQSGLPNGSLHPLYGTWIKMRSRCRNPNDGDFKYYGARGVEVCARWDSFWKFAADVGDKPSPQHSLDRIDNSGDYEPGNVRWATPQEQARNRRDWGTAS